jgi:hypothetical protein
MKAIDIETVAVGRELAKLGTALVQRHQDTESLEAIYQELSGLCDRILNVMVPSKNPK